ncbi:MAG: thioredoxin family protein [Anaerolineales bacterium]
MAAFINHYSFLLLAAAAGVVLLIFLSRNGIDTGDLMALLSFTVGITFALVTFNPGASDISNYSQFQSALEAEGHLLLEIQSPYCLACAAAKPSVDRLEDSNPQLEIIRVNIQDPVGQQISREFQSRVTPTFLLFDPDGEAVLRTFGALDSRSIQAELED